MAKRDGAKVSLLKGRSHSYKHLAAISIVLFAIIVAFVSFVTIDSCIRVNQQNYDYIKSLAEEEVVSLDQHLESALSIVRTFAQAKSDGVDTSKYAETTFFDRADYIEANSSKAKTLTDMGLYSRGLQGKAGIEVDFAKKLCDQVSLVFYAPVYGEGKVVGVVVGQVYQDSLSKILSTECYGVHSHSFLVTSQGDVVFTAGEWTEYIGKNLFTDYHGQDQLLSCSLDGVVGDALTFDAIKNALYNGSDVGYTCRYQGKSETSYVSVLQQKQFAVMKTFPYEVSDAMVMREMRLGAITIAALVLLMILVVFPLIKRFKRQEQIRMEAARMEASSAAKNEFFSKMSHDMRTPLNGILGMADIGLRHSDDTAAMVDSLGKIKSSGNYLLGLINEVLDMSKIEAGKMTLLEEPVNLPKLTEDIKVIVQNLLVGKDLAFAVELELEHPAVIADPVQIEKIVLNLLSNAIKYTPAGGSVSVSFGEEPSDKPGFGRYTMTVSDTGIGMSEDFLNNLFVAYEREEDVRVNKLQGTGLGLTIAKALSEMMHGDIQVESKQGVGSTFVVTVYLKIDEDGAAHEQAAQPVLDIDQIDCQGVRCLLVEDNDLNAEIAKELLSITGMTVEVACDGKQALDTFSASPVGFFNIIFMDIQMPVMNGYEATRAIRALPRPDAAGIPIVAMTANAYEQDVRDAVEAGMSDHLAKPIQQDKFCRVLIKHLEAKPL